MPRKNEFVEFVLEQMAALGGIRAAAMFGGHGIYQDDVMCALIADDKLYFKVDDASRDEFAAKGLGPFTYVARGKTMRLQYYEAPAEVFEDAESMRYWAGHAIATARRARKKMKPGLARNRKAGRPKRPRSS